MRLTAALALAVLLAACGRASQAQPTDAASPKALAIARVTPKSPSVSLGLTSPAVGPDGVFAYRYSAYGEGASPPVAWTQTPGAVSYAIVLEDPDAPQAATFVHWVVWNIPASASSLPQGLPDVARVAAPQGAVQGRNDDGSFGYYGPRPPSAAGPHHYHLEIFALDAPLELSSDESLTDLVNAMQGHVIADGELVGRAQAPR